MDDLDLFPDSRVNDRFLAPTRGPGNAFTESISLSLDCDDQAEDSGADT